jgi:uncharacterized membrane protein YdbT with pleckstrin-like domain
MSSYIQETLISGEEVVYQAKVSIWVLLPKVLLGALFVLVGIIVLVSGSAIFGLALIVAGLISFINAFLYYISTELAFTNKKVVGKWGFIRRRTIELNINKVETIQVDQDVLGRIFNYGSVIVAGAGIPQAPIRGISSPIKFRNAFTEYTNK